MSEQPVKATAAQTSTLPQRAQDCLARLPVDSRTYPLSGTKVQPGEQLMLAASLSMCGSQSSCQIWQGQRLAG